MKHLIFDFYKKYDECINELDRLSGMAIDPNYKLFGEIPIICFYSSFAKNGIVNGIINSGADIDLRDKWGMSAAFYAAIFGKIETLKFLIENGININAKDNYGSSILHCCCVSLQVIPSNWGMYNFLVSDIGINLNLKNSEGKDAQYYIDIAKKTINYIKFMKDVEIHEGKNQQYIDDNFEDKKEYNLVIDYINEIAKYNRYIHEGNLDKWSIFYKDENA